MQRLQYFNPQGQTIFNLLELVLQKWQHDQIGPHSQCRARDNVLATTIEGVASGEEGTEIFFLDLEDTGGA